MFTPSVCLNFEFKNLLQVECRSFVGYLTHCSDKTRSLTHILRLACKNITCTCAENKSSRKQRAVLRGNVMIHGHLIAIGHNFIDIFQRNYSWLLGSSITSLSYIYTIIYLAFVLKCETIMDNCFATTKVLKSFYIQLFTKLSRVNDHAVKWLMIQSLFSLFCIHLIDFNEWKFHRDHVKINYNYYSIIWLVNINVLYSWDLAQPEYSIVIVWNTFIGYTNGTSGNLIMNKLMTE